MSNFVNPVEMYSPQYESSYFKISNFFPIFNKEMENDNNSYEEKQNKEKDFELIFKKEFDSERFNIEKSNGVETQIKENQKNLYEILDISKAELSLVNTKCSSMKLNILNSKRKRNDDIKNEDKLKEKQIDEKKNEEIKF